MGYLMEIKSSNNLTKKISVATITAISTVIIIVAIFKPFWVPSDSMEPTIKTNSLIIALKDNHLFNYKRGEILVFRSEKMGDVALIKRAIGVPGDTINIIKETLYVNGKKLHNYSNVLSGIEKYPLVLKNNQYFFVGDNINSSYDSRYFGIITREKILGKYLFSF